MNSKEGWPLLTIETETNGVSRSTYERCPSLVGSLGSLCLYERFFSCLGCFSRPRSAKYKLFLFLTVHSFTSFYPQRLASWAGGRATSPVSLNMCRCYLQYAVTAQLLLTETPLNTPLNKLVLTAGLFLFYRTYKRTCLSGLP
jgi:hypothetical protein